MSKLLYILKLIGKLFAYTLLLLSYIFPRSKKIWVYGSNMGFAGNAKYLYIHTSTNEEIKSIWIGTKDESEEIRKLGLISYYRYSFKGILYSLIGGVYIYNSYVSDINLYTFGFAKRVNLWHGVGIKNCERKISTGPLVKIFKTKNPFIRLKHLPHFVKPHYFLSTSEQMKQLCKECFDLKYEQFIDNMYPRCDIFFMPEQDRKKFVSKYENIQTINLINHISEHSYSYLYMPTWRDSGFNFLHDFDFENLNETLKSRNELLIIKLHPVSDIKINDNYSNILIINKYVDLNSIMSYTDCLITDYSSVYYDYLTMADKRLILYIPDYEHYTSHDRDLAFDYLESTEGEFAYDFASLHSLISYRKPEQNKYERIDIIRQRFWGNAIGSNCSNLYVKLKDVLLNHQYPKVFNKTL